MDDQEARKQTKILMDMRQTIQSYGIAWYADGSFSANAANNYTYSPAQFNQLVDAWAPLVQKANIKVPPMAHVLLVEAVCTGPLLGLMQQNRKMRKRLQELEKQNSNLQQEARKVQTDRRDVATLWKLGENDKGAYGYFAYNQSGLYLKKEQRKERPQLTDENIKLIIKHNGADAIDRLKNK